MTGRTSCMHSRTKTGYLLHATSPASLLLLFSPYHRRSVPLFLPHFPPALGLGPSTLDRPHPPSPQRDSPCRSAAPTQRPPPASAERRSSARADRRQPQYRAASADRATTRPKAAPPHHQRGPARIPVSANPRTGLCIHLS